MFDELLLDELLLDDELLPDAGSAGDPSDTAMMNGPLTPGPKYLAIRS